MAKTVDDVTNDALDGMYEEKTATAQAVESLINVSPKLRGKDSDVELKTDLSLDQVKIHSTLDVLGKAIEMTPKEFKATCILPMVIEKLERKSLSKNRLSRQEIVNVARQPDMSMGMDMQEQNVKKGFIKGLFRPRQ